MKGSFIAATDRSSEVLPSTSSRSPGIAENEYHGWFDDQYKELHGEVTAERREWAEEMVNVTIRS
ncbi:hypothetical protein CC86DRAFT_370161 [Ophiobolus disseminans]|uniref:Uncharacterized protein n=1 Tax=Ophiobolus disseminans TaxID=1469910 RepID=A0A6A7A1G8_9PLEO|nr:hypothetical protein CC86DRAFT_370161 [Ophiobolus disseminans]